MAKYETNRAIAAQALVQMAECYQKMGNAKARIIYEQVVSCRRQVVREALTPEP